MDAAPTFTVTAKVAGSRRPLYTDWHVPLPPEREGGKPDMTLRDLITLVVATEVAAFKQRQTERRLDRVLSPEKIADGLAKGKIDAASKEYEQDVREDAAIATALTAFEDGLYFVFIDDVQHEALDQTVFVGADSRVLFVRLVALAGG